MPIWEYIKHGDTEAAVINILRNDTHIINFPDGAPTVSADYVGYTMGDRWIMVSREGGSKTWPSIDRPRIDFQVLAERRAVALELAQVAEAVVFQQVGQAFPTYGVFIASVVEETAPFRAPDRETGSTRYVFALRFTCKPTFN